MQVKQLVRATAQAITVVDLTEGSVFKRLHKEAYSQTYSVKLGIVTGVAHNGEDAMITAIEIDPEQSGSAIAKVRVFGTDTEDLKLFPADPAEIDAIMEQAMETAINVRSSAQYQLDAAVKQIDRLSDIAGRLASGEALPALTAPAPGHPQPAFAGPDVKPDVETF